MAIHFTSTMHHITDILLCTLLVMVMPISSKPLTSLQSTILPALSTITTDPVTTTNEEQSGLDITTAPHTSITAISDSEKPSLQMSLADARIKASDALENYGNQPLAREMRGDMATQEFAELIAPYFPLFLPKLGSVQDDADEEASLRILERETRLLTAFSKECLDLEQAYVTRHGGECGMPTNKRELNYFCRETRSSMASLTNAFTEFHTKLSKWISSPSDETETAQIYLPSSNGAQATRYNILVGLYRIQQRAKTLEEMLSQF